MALTDDQAAEAFRFLSQALRGLGLDWVVTQVEEKVALGKVKPKKLRAIETPDVPVALWAEGSQRAGGSSKAAFFAVAETYTIHERLEILIDSIAFSVPTIHQVADQTFVTLGKLGIEGRLVFEPEAEVRDGFSLDEQQLRMRIPSGERLLALLSDLEQGEFDGEPEQPPH